jgi:hypothetical protein
VVPGLNIAAGGGAMALKTPLLRHIARYEIAQLFPGIAPDALEEYVTSVVRQWITNDLRAGVFTVAVNYWMHLVEMGEQVHAGLEVCPSSMRQTLAPWLVLESDLPRIIHELTLAQSATFVNADGVTVRVSAHPKEHSFRFEEVKDEDDFEE